MATQLLILEDITNERLRVTNAELSRKAGDALRRCELLEKRIEERSRELQETQNDLVAIARKEGMSEIATSVLHNIGNALNSVNVAATMVIEGLQHSKVSGLQRVVALIQEHQADLAAFLTRDDRGRQVTAYLAKLTEALVVERTGLSQEMNALVRGIDHMKGIITTQQSYAKVAGASELVSLVSMIDDTLQLNAATYSKADIEVGRAYDLLPPVLIEKHKVLQVLLNLLANARHAIEAHDGEERRVTVQVILNAAGMIQIDVIDTGVGIPPENHARIFSRGFTTKKSGHGFGLHSCALAATEMGGSLSYHSEGVGKGTTFSLLLPFQPAGLPSGA